MAKVIIFGAGRAADVAYRYLTADSEHEIVAFTVDQAFLRDDRMRGLPVVPFETVQTAFPPADYKILVFMGFEKMNQLRRDKYLEAKAKGYECITYLSSHLTSVETPVIGENCFILEGQILNMDVRIGDNVVMWSGNHIGDGSRIMDHCWLSSHVCIAGSVTIEPLSVLGINASVSHNVTVRSGSFVGANAHISADTEENGVYILPSTPKAPLSSDRFLAVMRGTQ